MHRFHLIGEVLDPLMVETKDIISEPDMLDPIHLFQLSYLCRHGAGGPNLELIPRDWLGAPVAAVRAPATGHDVPGEVTVRRDPCATIRLEIDQFARGFRKCTPRWVLRSLVGALNWVACAVEVDDAWDFQVGTPGKDGRAEFDQRLLGFATKNKIHSVAKVSFGLIGCIGAVGDDDGSCFASFVSQLPS